MPEPESGITLLAIPSDDKRDAFDLYFHQQNDELRKQGLYLEINRWENFLDAI